MEKTDYKNILILDLSSLISFFLESGRLKQIKRSGWIRRGIPDSESVADHTFRTCMMAFILSNNLANLDRFKCVSIALIHDLGESIIGDITPFDNITEKEKKRMERDAIESLSKLSGDNEILELWSEFESGSSPEAQFVRDLDKLETVFQAMEYGIKNDHKQSELQEFFTEAENSIKTPLLKQILLELHQRRKKSDKRV